MVGLKRNLLLVLVVVWPLLTSAQEAPVREVELTHWWQSPGEQAALNEIKKAVEARGAKFTALALDNYDVLRARVIERFAMGIPPAMTQWLGGRDMQDLLQVGAIKPLPGKWRDFALQDILFPEVLAEIQQNKQVAGVPVGIHIQNSAFYNAAIYRELDLQVPKTWGAFFQQADKIAAAGYLPIALSDETWQLRRIFDAMLMEQMGTERYQLFYNEEVGVEQFRTEIARSIELFLRLRNYADKGHVGRKWNEVSQLMIEGKAALQIMGDFVKGEILHAGLVPGQDFICELAPGANGVMIYAIDTFVMLEVDSKPFKEGQALLFDVLLDPVVQAAYSSKKGGIPVRFGVDSQKLDPCARPIYEAWTHQGDKQKRLSDGRSRLRFSFVQNLIQRLWKQELSTEQGIEELFRIMK